MTIDKLEESKFYVEDTSGLDVSEFENVVAKMVKKYGAKIVIIDYLQLMEYSKAKSEQESISKVARTLKQVAMNYNVAVIALVAGFAFQPLMGAEMKVVVTGLVDLKGVGQGRIRIAAVDRIAGKFIVAGAGVTGNIGLLNPKSHG